MKTYFATFIPGLSEAIKEALLKDCPKIEILKFFESSILFKSEDEYQHVVSLPYINNVFLVANHLHFDRNKKAGSIAKELLKDAQFKQFIPNTKNVSFRIMIQKGADLIHIPREFSGKIIDKITQQTGFVFAPLKASVEYWFLIRNEGLAILGIKLTNLIRRSPGDNQQGKLQPEIANILNFLSEPHKDDVYLDPFAGYGSLAKDRILFNPYKHIYLSDIEKPLVERLRKLNSDKVTVQLSDALHLDYLKDKSVNKVVTDPPWGVYEMKNEMQRVVKTNGIIIILTARFKEFEKALLQTTLHLFKKYSTLVNGKKATIYKLTSV